VEEGECVTNYATSVCGLKLRGLVVEEGECVTNLGGPVSHELVDHDVQEVCKHTHYVSIFYLGLLLMHVLGRPDAHA
jgi:hypothetical protein